MKLLNRITGAMNALLGRAQWDAAGGGNRLANWKAQPTAANSWMDNPIMVRARAEDANRNNALARRGVASIVNAAIGAAGLNPMFQDKAVQSVWQYWADSCDATGRAGWVELLQQILETTIVSGEAFVVLGVNPDQRIPLDITVLGPEFLDTSRVDRETYAGIRFNGKRRAGYWFYQQSPVLSNVGLKSVFVPAEQVFHVFRPIHPGAQRGVSWLSPVLLDLYELGAYLEAALTKQRVAALFAGYVQTADGSNPMANDPNATPILEPGTMSRLKPGEIVEFSKPPDIGAEFDPFVRAILRRIAAGLGVPYEVLSGDLSAVTFASGRHGLLEWQRHVEAIQHSLMVAQFCAPLMRKWMALGIGLGVLPEGITEPRWIGPRIEMLDPRAETAAMVQRVRAGFTSRKEVVASSGWRVDDIDAEIAEDNARADQLGLVLDSDPRRMSQQGQEQPSEAKANG